MTKKFFMIIAINIESDDYDTVMNFMYTYPGITKLYIVPQGLFIEVSFEDDINRRAWIGNIIKLDIDELTFHEILYEEFIPQKNEKQRNRS